MKEIEKKKVYLEEKEQHSLEVRKQNEQSMQMRVNDIRNKRLRKEKSLEATMAKRNHDLKLKREMELIKKEDREDNVDRIAKANEHKKELILEKI